MTMRSLFTRCDDGWSPTTDALAPWDSGLLPGGPVAALLAEAMQLRQPVGSRLAQLNVLFLAPTPATTLRPVVTLVHRGRHLTVLDAAASPSSRPTARATGIYVIDEPDGSDAKRSMVVSRPSDHALLDLRGLIPNSHGSALQLRPITRPDPERDAAWINYPGTVTDGTDPDPTLHTVIAADIATALLWADRSSISHINPTLTLHLRRRPRGQHTALIPNTVTDGFGCCEVHDEHGLLGLVTITALAHQERRATR